MKENIRYLDIPLEEIKRDLENQRGSFDTIKANVRSVLSSASLIISLVGALQLATARIDPAWIWLYWGGLILAAALYVVLLVVCCMALMPVRVYAPIAAEWNYLTTAYKDISEKDSRLKQMSSTLNVIDKNAPLLNKLARLQIAALILLPIIVIVILSLGLIPRI
jgi:hypothetical protein